MLSFDALPSNRINTQKSANGNAGMACTFDNCLHVSDETMYDTQCLCNSHPSLVLGQSIQSLENCLYLALPEQLFGEFFYGILSQSNG